MIEIITSIHAKPWRKEKVENFALRRGKVKTNRVDVRTKKRKKERERGAREIGNE